jgi:hypothetical protein
MGRWEGRLLLGLLWITTLDALTWSQNAVFERLALAQAIILCLLAIAWAAKSLFFARAANKSALTGPVQGTQYIVSDEHSQLLAEKYRGILHAALEETIERQNKARMQQQLLIQKAIENSGRGVDVGVHTTALDKSSMAGISMVYSGVSEPCI